MTEQVQAQQNPIDPAQVAQPEPRALPKITDHEELQRVKNSLIQILQSIYRNFIHVAGQLQIKRDVLLKAIEYFDAGFLDMQKGIVLAELTHVPPILLPPEPQPPAATAAQPEMKAEEPAQPVAESAQNDDNADAA